MFVTGENAYWRMKRCAAVILSHVFAAQLQHRAVGIRIEDDARVTANGCELISPGVPVGVAVIEALMRS